MMNGIWLLVLANIINFVQIQGQFKYEWVKDNSFLVACLGVPISYLYIYAVKYLVEAYDGKMWPSRLLSFAVGIIIFTAMSKIWFNENPDGKTAVSLLLAAAIIALRIY